MDKLAGWGTATQATTAYPDSLTRRLEAALVDLKTSVQDNDPNPEMRELTRSIGAVADRVAQNNAGLELKNVTQTLIALNDTVRDTSARHDLDRLVTQLARFEEAVNKQLGSIAQAISSLTENYPDGSDGRRSSRSK